MPEVPILLPLHASGCFTMFLHVYWSDIGHEPWGTNGTHVERHCARLAGGSRTAQAKRDIVLADTRRRAAPRLSKAARPQRQTSRKRQVGLAPVRRRSSF